MPFTNKKLLLQDQIFKFNEWVFCCFFFMCLMYPVTSQYLAISLFSLEGPPCGLTLLHFSTVVAFQSQKCAWLSGFFFSFLFPLSPQSVLNYLGGLFFWKKRNKCWGCQFDYKCGKYFLTESPMFLCNHMITLRK